MEATYRVLRLVSVTQQPSNHIVLAFCDASTLRLVETSQLITGSISAHAAGLHLGGAPISDTATTSGGRNQHEGFFAER